MGQTFNADSVIKEGYNQDKGGVLAQEMALQADLAVGQLQHINAQLSDTPGTVITIALPTWARYVKLIPQDAMIAFAFDETPAIDAANVGAGNALSFATAGTVGEIVDVSEVAVRIIPSGITAIKMICGTANAKVWVSASGG